MFGKPPGGNNHMQRSRPAAADVARIQGGGLVQVIITSVDPITFYLFLNDRAVEQVDVDSLFVDIVAPGEGSSSDCGTVNAVLSHRVRSVTGESSMDQLPLFPCTIEILALGRRIVVVAAESDSFEGLWITLGLKGDGSDSPVTGASGLRILLNQSLLDAKLTWNDGTVEDLLPR